MHILFLTDNFPPEVNAPASRTFEHCREWVNAGHQVTVITCFPNFPSGQVYEGIQNTLRPVHEEKDRIKIIRVWSYITANNGFIKRTLDYISFMVSSILFSSKVHKVDVVIGTSPQFFTSCAAYIVGLFKRVPFIFELRDLWPESIRAVGAIKNKRLLWVLERMELYLYRRSKLIVSVTRSFKGNLIKRGIDGSKIKVVTNGVDLTRFTPHEKDERLIREFGVKNKFVAGYIGTHGMAHSLETVLEAGQLLMEWGETDIQLILLGDGARKKDLQKRAEVAKIKNLIFIPSVTKEQVPKYWSILNAAIIHLKNDPTFETVIPSKLFECMGMGLPVLHGVRGESAQIVKQSEVGIVFDPENAKQLAEAIIKLRDDQQFAESCRIRSRTAAKKYDRKKKAKQMLSELTRLLK